MEQQVKVGDFIVMGDYKYEVIKIDGKLIWYKIPYGVGQTIRENINKIITNPANKDNV